MNMELLRCELGGWEDIIRPMAEEAWCKELLERVTAAYQKNDPPVYPKQEDLFTALRLTPPEKVKCVIVGQDPYHQPGQAHGLAFSVLPGTKIPPSLRNIGKELQADLGVSLPEGGTLTPWAEEGVLLLNNVLTVYDSTPNSHKKWGWTTFTTRLLQALENQPQPIAFVLWGREAQSKGELVGAEQTSYPRLVLKSNHPSPLSASRGFFGSKPFSQVNDFLIQHGSEPIRWG
jgi:uracil-DNA glycosylase